MPLLRARRVCRLFFCVLVFLVPAKHTIAGEYSLTGLQEFTRDRGRPEWQTKTFDAPAPGNYYLLRIHNGPGDLRPVDAGWISINRDKTINLADLHQRQFRGRKPFDCPFWKRHCRDRDNESAEPVEIPLDLELTNELAVKLYGRRGSGLRLEVISIGDENAYFNEFPLLDSRTINPVFGWPQEQTLEFSAPVAGAHYQLRLRNGDGELLPVATGWVWLNDRELLGPQDFARERPFCRKGHHFGLPWRPGFGRPCETEREVQLPLSLEWDNTLTVKLLGHWHSGVQLEIVGVDNGLPLISAAVNPAANDAGWHNSDATVSFLCSDGLAGIEHCSEPVLVSEEGAEQEIAGTAVDRAGNSADTQVTVSLDKTAPTLTATIEPTANEAGWHRQAATIRYRCEDALSGIADCPAEHQVSGEGTDQRVAASATDIAGNSTAIERSVSLDLTPPEIATTIAPPANTNGWHNSPVALEYQCSDHLSGVADCPGERVESEQGLNREIAVTATDAAGNITNSSTQLSIDTTPPAIQPQLSTAANAAGWHRAPVTVSYQCSDNLSGIATCPQPQRLAGDGANQAVNGSALDLAGNTATADISVNLDRTPPEISFLAPANGELLREPQPELQLLVSDNLALDEGSLEVTVAGQLVSSCAIASGVARCALAEPIPADSEVSIQAAVSDLAGNTGEAGIATALDSDGDTVADYTDLCADTAGSEVANDDGCGLSQLDSDNDGVSDAGEIAAGSDPEDDTSFPPVSIETFAASPAIIDSQGQRVELRWRAEGAQQVELRSDAGDESRGDLAGEGALVVNPQITTNYTLVVRGPGGESSRQLTVKLDLPPPPDLWTEPSIPVEEQIATSLAVADDGSAYVGAFDGNFYKVDPRGQVEWTMENAGLVMGKAAISGERVIVGANTSGSGQLEKSGRVYALAADKTLLWQFDTEGAVVAGPLLSADQAVAYIATYSGNIYALDSESGGKLWQFKLPQGQTIAASPALSGQKLIVHTEAKQIFALDAVTPSAVERVLWSRNLE